MGLAFAHCLRALCNFRGNPLRECNFARNVPARSRVLFMHLRNSVGRKSLRHSNQRRPEPAVNEGHLAIHETANEHIVRIGHRLEDGEYVVAPGMRPPAALDGFPGDRLGQPRNRALGRYEDDAVLLDERQRLRNARDSR